MRACDTKQLPPGNVPRCVSMSKLGNVSTGQHNLVYLNVRSSLLALKAMTFLSWSPELIGMLSIAPMERESYGGSPSIQPRYVGYVMLAAEHFYSAVASVCHGQRGQVLEHLGHEHAH